MLALAFSLTARPIPFNELARITTPSRVVEMDNMQFLVTADGPDALRLLEAFDPLNIEHLRDRIEVLLQRGNVILADMAERDAAAS